MNFAELTNETKYHRFLAFKTNLNRLYLEAANAPTQQRYLNARYVAQKESLAFMKDFNELCERHLERHQKYVAKQKIYNKYLKEQVERKKKIKNFDADSYQIGYADAALTVLKPSQEEGQRLDEISEKHHILYDSFSMLLTSVVGLPDSRDEMKKRTVKVTKDGKIRV